MISIADCREVVGTYYRIKKETMLGPKRKRKIARPRQMVMTLARELTGASYPLIARQLGRKDHTTAIFAKNRINELEMWHEPTRADMENFRLVLLTWKFQQEAPHP
jgi:chromosomal replication initiator protein